MIYKLLFLGVVVLLGINAQVLFFWDEEPKPSPIIFVPGKGGNQIDASIDRSWVTYDHCPKKSDGWFRVWLNVWDFFLGRVRCWSDNVRLYYNETTRRSANTPGVQLRVPGWGDTHTIEYVDDSYMARFFSLFLGDLGAYATNLFDELTSWGLERKVSIRGAPYDFRMAPHSQGEYYKRLRRLIMDTYNLNNRQPVVLLSHSMGGIMAMYFLNQQTLKWKQKYIKAFVPVNSPWGGSLLVAHLYASGFNWNIWVIDTLIMRTQQRSYETGVMLLPSPASWGSDEPIIITPQRNYTTDDYDDFFDDVGSPAGKSMLNNIRHQSYNYTHPGVDTYCIFSSGIPTFGTLVYKDNDFPDGQPIHLSNNGDGTVSRRSLAGCETWLRKDGQFANMSHVIEFKDINHVDLLNDRQFQNILKDVAFM